MQKKEKETQKFMKEQNEIGCLPATILFFGGIFLFSGVIGIQWIGEDGFDGVASFITVPLGVFLILLGLNKQRDFKIEIEKKKNKRNHKDPMNP